MRSAYLHRDYRAGSVDDVPCAGLRWGRFCSVPTTRSMTHMPKQKTGNKPQTLPYHRMLPWFARRTRLTCVLDEIEPYDRPVTT